MANYLIQSNISVSTAKFNISFKFHNWLTGSERCDDDFKIVISEHMIWINFMSSLREIILKLMPQKLFDGKSTLVQVMAWCHQEAQANTWANVDPDLCHHMASWGHDELMGHW